MKLFRKFRSNMILNRRISKYLMYAAGEILLVMIGILLALKVNTINEQHKAKEEEKSILEQIKKDLIQEQKAFNSLINSHQNYKDYLINFKNSSLQEVGLDSLFYNLNMYQGFEPRNAGYIGLKSSNKIKSLQNDSLRSLVIRYYENGLGVLTNNSKWEENFVINYIEKFIIENDLPINEEFIIQDRNYMIDEPTKKRLHTLINYKIAAHNYLISIISTTKRRNQSIVNNIDDELNLF